MSIFAGNKSLGWDSDCNRAKDHNAEERKAGGTNWVIDDHYFFTRLGRQLNHVHAEILAMRNANEEYNEEELTELYKCGIYGVVDFQQIMN